MKRLTRLALASLSLASLALALPALAHADEAFVTADVNMRAGPDPGYPLIDQIRAGTEVDVQGCTPGYEWCDVIAYDNRGWVAGTYINYEYQDQPVFLPSYGAQIGIPIIGFTIGTYWASHYYNRPFYRERDNWYHYRYARRAPPPPSHPYRGPIHRWSSPGHGGYPRDHLGPVGPGYPVYANPSQRSMPSHEGYQRPEQPRSTPRFSGSPMRPVQVGVPNRSDERHDEPRPMNSGRPMPQNHEAPPIRQVYTRGTQPPRQSQRPERTEHSEHRPDRKDDNNHDH